RSYLVGCEEDRVAAIVDPILDRAERYAATAASRGLAIQYLIDTHTHADHFSATRHIARELGAPVVMHRASPAPFVDLAVQDGDSLTLGTLRIRVLHTPGHTADSMCLVLPDRVLTGDTLLLGSLGRTDLPTRDAARAIAFMSIAELRRRVERRATDVAIVDVREADAYAKGHVPGAIHIPRGQLELLVDRHFPDPATRVLAYCEFGKISTLAAA